MLDTVIRNGLVVDGTGAPGFHGDVGIRDGRVVAVGDVDDRAAEVIDATDLVVAPGFVDLHTHYDAQILWDPWATPSIFHGVTTVIGGNCGFTVAPRGTDEDFDYLTRLLARVEGIPLEALHEGVNATWASVGEWLDGLEGTLGVNAGFLAGHSTIRRIVMGERSVEETATPADLDRMLEQLHEALAAGALGLSTSRSRAHNDPSGSPVPSRTAEREELRTLAAAVSEHPGTTLGIVVTGALLELSDDEIALMATMSKAADRPINWNVLTINSKRPESFRHQLEASSRAAEQGGLVKALVLPGVVQTWNSFWSGFALDALPGWAPVFKLAPEERLAALRDPELRARLDEGARSPDAGILGDYSDWGAWEVAEVFEPDNEPLVGRRIADIARERGAAPFDALLDIVISDGLRAFFRPPLAGGTDDRGWEMRAESWTDPRTIVGGSDAGAHLDLMCGAIYTTQLLAEGVRERELITLEEAVHQLTDVPARFYGLAGRGRVVEGGYADLVLFDPRRVGYGTTDKVYDLPAGAPRLTAAASGIEQVLVNGVPVVSAGELTGRTPGTVLRSGRDTTTVSVGPTR